MKKVFIDGSAGTTGLRIFDRLNSRDDLTVITLPDAIRKDPNARADALNNCDLAFLCLPDEAAVEAVNLTHNPDVVLLDTSTAHRTNPKWDYGFPELNKKQAEKIRSSKRIAVPGCHASGFIALVYPLVASGILSSETLLTCHSITGYSGGGKKMIAAYHASDRPMRYDAPRQYGLSQQHKHLKEMKTITGLASEPIFCPIVADYYSGMEVTVPVFKQQLKRIMNIDSLSEFYHQWYQNGLVTCVDVPDMDGFLSACTFSGKDTMSIYIGGNDDRILLTARFDNLGKGASGAAIECMNLVLGLDPTTGLEI